MPEELREPLEGRLDGVGEREARDRLAHELEQRAAPLELEPELRAPAPTAERVRGAHREAGEPPELLGLRRRPGRKQELHGAERRLAERKRHERLSPTLSTETARWSCTIASANGCSSALGAGRPCEPAGTSPSCSVRQT